ncbi:hypothetical protein [uncultured Roseivirga sp.]|uniref:hypothetical protein n=1 Tax=uncultured Roseivirga sp. TaxID=543088 RepID=UPI0030D96FB3
MMLSLRYMASPQAMRMDMHMLGAMYAVSDRITLAVMANYLSNSMDLKIRMGMDFETSSFGLGDVTMAVLVCTGKFSTFQVTTSKVLSPTSGKQAS